MISASCYLGRLTVLFTLSTIANTRDEVAGLGKGTLVADGEFGAQSSSVVRGSAPDISNGITDGGVQREWMIAQNTGLWSDEDGVNGSLCGLGGIRDGLVDRGRSTMLSNAFYGIHQSINGSRQRIEKNVRDTQSS